MTTTNPNSTYDSTDTTVTPAAHTWTDPMPGSLEEQVAFFRREGFLVIRDVLGDEALAELDSELRRLIRDYQKLPAVREGFGLEPNQDASRLKPTFRKIGGVADLSEPFAALMRHPRVLARLHPIMGDIIELWRDVVMMKPAHVGREKPWHQDSSYWPWEPMSLVSAMTALDDATPDNGCLQIIPRTHHEALQHYGQELQVDIDADRHAATYYVPLRRGDTLLFHSLLLHASEPNTSATDRRVCIFSYKTPGTRFIGKGKPRPNPLVSQR